MGLMDESNYKVLRTTTERGVAIRQDGHSITRGSDYRQQPRQTAQEALNDTQRIEASAGLEIVAIERQRPAAMTVGDLIAFLSTVDPELTVATFKEGSGDYCYDEDMEAITVGVEDGYVCISSQDHGLVSDKWSVTGVEISEADVTALRADFVAKRQKERVAAKMRQFAALAVELGVVKPSE